MPTQAEVKQLVKALREIGADTTILKMASILLAVNGIENALEFVARFEKPKIKQLSLFEE